MAKRKMRKDESYNFVSGRTNRPTKKSKVWR